MTAHVQLLHSVVVAGPTLNSSSYATNINRVEFPSYYWI